MIRLDIPGFGLLEIHRVVSDYTGTHASRGVIREAVRTRLIRLSEVVEIHFLTSDTFGTSRRELADIPGLLARCGAACSIAVPSVYDGRCVEEHWSFSSALWEV
jgi:hypothetical protein